MHYSLTNINREIFKYFWVNQSLDRFYSILQIAFVTQNSYGGRGWRVLQQSGRLLRIRGGVREEELPRGGAFLPTVRSGRLAVGNGAESSQKGPAHFRISDHVTTVTGKLLILTPRAPSFKTLIFVEKNFKRRETCSFRYSTRFETVEGIFDRRRGKRIRSSNWNDSETRWTKEGASGV